MDLAAKKEARAARLQAKREAISAQASQIDPTEADSVAEAPTPEAIGAPAVDVKDQKPTKAVDVPKPTGKKAE